VFLYQKTSRNRIGFVRGHMAYGRLVQHTLGECDYQQTGKQERAPDRVPQT